MSEDAQRGLYRKYVVHRIDGSVKHRDCAYFVLDVNHDPFAKDALLAYAKACAGSHPNLAADLESALASDDPVGKIKKLF
jgi:hypothetical protein